jgi:hypothetical protein
VLDECRPDTAATGGQRKKHEPDRTPPDRYEPLPGLVQLPGWLWRKMGRASRIAAVVALLGVVAVAVALAPTIQESKQKRLLSEQRERAERRAKLIRELEAEQRPHFGRSSSVAPPGAEAAEQLAARGRILDELIDAILRDARRRVRLGKLDRPPIRMVECEPFPRTVTVVGADKDLSRRRGRYSCIAVTSKFERTESSVGLVTGHPYRALVDFKTGRYAYCKISGQADPSAKPLVTTPQACTGR